MRALLSRQLVTARRMVAPRSFATMAPRVALLYQGLDAPVINGVSKPKKAGGELKRATSACPAQQPGPAQDLDGMNQPCSHTDKPGYTDSCADIANALKTSGVPVITPSPNPDPADVNGWSFPDTEAGILAAVEAGANCLWANTVVFEEHPLQVSRALDSMQDDLRIVGHPPVLVQAVDDKHRVNAALRARGDVFMAKGTMVRRGDSLTDTLKAAGLAKFPMVGKPVRGRGSQGVKLCQTAEELDKHLQALFQLSGEVIVEEFLPGEEGTVTVMPPMGGRTGYWALPVMMRFNHVDGVTLYSGLVPVSDNSRIVTAEEAAADPAYAEAMRECEKVAEFVGGFAPMRVDIRRVEDKALSKFAIFDVNMKPVSAGAPGGWLLQVFIRRSWLLI
jgi:hypothetical protein